MSSTFYRLLLFGLTVSFPVSSYVQELLRKFGEIKAKASGIVSAPVWESVLKRCLALQQPTALALLSLYDGTARFSLPNLFCLQVVCFLRTS
jgi:hypothetical protein